MFHLSSSPVRAFCLHVLVWSYVFLAPFFLYPYGVVDWEYVAMQTLLSLLLCLCFYLNYSVLVPLLFWKRQYRWFVLSNLLLIFLLPQLIELVLHQELFTALIQDEGDVLAQSIETEISKSWGHRQKSSSLFHVAYYLRNVLSLALVGAAAIALRLVQRWRSGELLRKEAELLRTEAELLNLKHQLSPHFLLNTLNNIYALIGINQGQAQCAVLELSKMLRYQLYESWGTQVPLQKEIDFLQNYVALMRLRLTDSVRVQTKWSLPAVGTIKVAAQIFISLVENAFKHGVSPCAPSYIEIALCCEGDELIFTTCNTNFPKSKHDKAQGGLGLKQVKRQLELVYPNAHQFNYGANADGSIFTSEIRIRITKQDEHTLTIK